MLNVKLLPKWYGSHVRHAIDWIEFPHQVTKWTVQRRCKVETNKNKSPYIYGVHKSAHTHKHVDHLPLASRLALCSFYFSPPLDVMFQSILNPTPPLKSNCFKLSFQPILLSRQKPLDVQDIKGKSRLKSSKCRVWTLLLLAPKILFS